MTVLSRLLDRVGARDISLRRAEDTVIRPKVFARIEFIETLFSPTLDAINDCIGSRFVFSIDWDMLEAELSSMSLDSFAHGWKQIPVRCLSRQFQNSVVRSMVSCMQDDMKLLGERTRLSFLKDAEHREVVFIPSIRSFEELVVWLDLNDIDEDKNI